MSDAKGSAAYVEAIEQLKKLCGEVAPARFHPHAAARRATLTDSACEGFAPRTTSHVVSRRAHGARRRPDAVLGGSPEQQSRRRQHTGHMEER